MTLSAESPPRLVRIYVANQTSPSPPRPGRRREGAQQRSVRQCPSPQLTSVPRGGSQTYVGLGIGSDPWRPDTELCRPRALS